MNNLWNVSEKLTKTYEKTWFNAESFLLYFQIRVICTSFYERIICVNRDLGWSEKRGEHVGFECG